MIATSISDDPYYDNCVDKEEWNAVRCVNLNIGQLIFESLDEDRMTRNIQPIFIDDVDGDFFNTLNSGRDYN